MAHIEYLVHFGCVQGEGTELRKENTDAESPYCRCVLQVVMLTLLNVHK
jgi:hypothetical protein